MTHAEIKRRYAGQWVLIKFGQLDRNLEVIDGEVVAYATTKEEIYKRQLEAGAGTKLAVEYCGEWLEDISVMFCLQLTRQPVLVVFWSVAPS